MLTVSDLHVAYGGVSAVRRVSITVAAGEVVTLLGANGAGKSSLLQAIMGVVKSSGCVSLFGSDISRVRPNRAVRMGVRFVPEGGGVLNELTVEENLLLGVPGSSARRRADTIGSAVDLFPAIGNRLESRGGQLSGGERQMVALARAINASPKILLLDEPSLGIAPIIVDQVFLKLSAMAQSGTGILVAEQNARRVLGVCDRGYVLQRGEVVASGTASALLASDEMSKYYLT